MKKQGEFQRLRTAFDEEVRRVYDEKLQGNYFIHQHALNRDGRGLDYGTGGEELARRGAKLIVSTLDLHANEFSALLAEKIKDYRDIMTSGEDKLREKIQDEVNKLNRFTSSVRELSDERYHLSIFPYTSVYPAVSHFSEITPVEYRQGLGEMLFHQLRLLNMCGLGEADPLQFGSLDHVLWLIPDKEFLSEERKQQLGEGLIREILKSKDGCKAAVAALHASWRYDVEDRDLHKAIEQMIAIEGENKERMGELTGNLKRRKEEYTASREAILQAIGEKMHVYDYRE